GIPAGGGGKKMIPGRGGGGCSGTIIFCLWALLGCVIEHSCGAEALADYFRSKLSDKPTIASLCLGAVFLGIPVLFGGVSYTHCP
ncbi:hypothetical protein Q2374_27870, partial [Escherichia coli]|nr:hypothetical protein [Escherichia coli]